MNDVTFNGELTMNKRWVDQFCSMLKYMESCGNNGHSSITAFYADGDGDFHPNFNIGIDYEKKEGYLEKDIKEKMPTPEVIFDAG